MAKRRRKASKLRKSIIVVVILIVAILVDVLIYVANTKNSNDETMTKVNTTTTTRTTNTTEEQNVNEVITEEDIGDVEEVVDDDDEYESKVKQYEGEDPNREEELSGWITSSVVSNGMLRIRVNIDQYLASGTCTLNLINGGTTVYTGQVAISPSPSTSTCEGFDVSTENLGSGTVDIYITLSSGDKTGTITGEVKL